MTRSNGFSQLYQAALSATDVEEKSRLLGRVNLILSQWQQGPGQPQARGGTDLAVPDSGRGSLLASGFR